jgi:glycosyltransferase involved in cell wall biosynthesis
MKIAVITPVFALAGVPLAQIRFARAIASRGHTVELIIGRVLDDDSFTPPEGINTIILDRPNVRSLLLPLKTYLQQQQPDLVFSAEDHLTVIVLLAALISGSPAKISGSSRILPTDRLAYSNAPFTKGWVFKQVMRLVMKRATMLTCVSRDMVRHYKALYPNGPHQCIYNIIKDSTSLQRSIEIVHHPWLGDQSIPVVVTAGTLTKRKGFGVLIKAFAQARLNRKVRLILLGEGYLRSELESEVQRLGLSEDVDMPGNVTNPLAYFSRSRVIVLSSYAEGLPNVLVEGMMCGCTPVATDCPTGPREVLGDGKYGYLVPMGDPKAMGEAILQAIDHPIPKILLDEAVAPFEEARVIARHFQLLGLSE